MAIAFAPLLREILEGYPLPWAGWHGVAHWARVMENGLRLAAETGADEDVVRLFAVLHDSRRVDEGTDLEHGPRAAEYARALRGRLFDLPDRRFELLTLACAGHTSGRRHEDPTIGTCWDADRLDLGRVGITPSPRFLSTQAARRPETLRWADDRAWREFVPGLVRDDWGVDLAPPDRRGGRPG